MNIYLENGGLFRNVRHLRRCRAFLGDEPAVHLHLFSQRKIHPAALYLLAFRFGWLKNMTVEMAASVLTPAIVSLFNRKPLLTLQVRVDDPLTDLQWKRISKISGRIVIRDSTDDPENERRYLANRNVVYQNQKHDGIAGSNAYAACSGMPMIGCAHTSCLGKTLYVSQDGNLSYCPYYPAETAIGKLGDTKMPFHDPGFLATLRGSLEKREACKQSCGLFPVCQAGCPLTFACAQFQKSCVDAREALTRLVETHAELSALPLYQEYAVLYGLFCVGGKSKAVDSFARRDEK